MRLAWASGGEAWAARCGLRRHRPHDRRGPAPSRHRRGRAKAWVDRHGPAAGLEPTAAEVHGDHPAHHGQQRAPVSASASTTSARPASPSGGTAHRGQARQHVGMRACRRSSPGGAARAPRAQGRPALVRHLSPAPSRIEQSSSQCRGTKDTSRPSGAPRSGRNAGQACIFVSPSAIHACHQPLGAVGRLLSERGSLGDQPIKAASRVVIVVDARGRSEHQGERAAPDPPPSPARGEQYRFPRPCVSGRFRCGAWRRARAGVSPAGPRPSTGAHRRRPWRGPSSNRKRPNFAPSACVSRPHADRHMPRPILAPSARLRPRACRITFPSVPSRSTRRRSNQGRALEDQRRPRPSARGSGCAGGGQAPGAGRRSGPSRRRTARRRSRGEWPAKIASNPSSEVTQ